MFFKNKVRQCIIKFQTVEVLRRGGQQGSAPWSLQSGAEDFGSRLGVCSGDPFTCSTLIPPPASLSHPVSMHSIGISRPYPLESTTWPLLPVV